MTNGKILGLDIGIASVGVGVIDAQTGEIIHASSRIFHLQILLIMQNAELFVEVVD